MKQNIVLVALTTLAALYCLLTLSITENIVIFIGAGVMYKLTDSLVATLLVFIILPIVSYMNQLNKIVMKKEKEGFHTDGAVQISDRVKTLVEEGKQRARPAMLTGVLERADIENFQSVMDASGSEVFTDKPEDMGAPGISVPAFVREKGRLLVIPEMAVPRVGSEEQMPRGQTIVEGADTEGESTALIADGAKLPVAEKNGEMSVGPMAIQ